MCNMIMSDHIEYNNMFCREFTTTEDNQMHSIVCKICRANGNRCVENGLRSKYIPISVAIIMLLSHNPSLSTSFVQVCNEFSTSTCNQSLGNQFSSNPHAPTFTANIEFQAFSISQFKRVLTCKQ